MPALSVAYALPFPAYEDTIDQLVAELVPDRRLLHVADLDTLVASAQADQIVLIRLRHSTELPCVLTRVPKLVSSGCSILLQIRHALLLDQLLRKVLGYD